MAQVKLLRDCSVNVNFQTGFCKMESIKLRWTLRNYFKLKFNEYYENTVPELEKTYHAKWKIMVLKTQKDIRLSLSCGIQQKIVKFTFINGGGKTIACSEATEILPGSYFASMERSFIENRISRGFPTIECKVLMNTEQGEPSICFPTLENWNDFGDVSEAMENLYSSSRFSDFTIIIGEMSFFVHKAILQARSSYFAQLFETLPNLPVLTLSNTNYDLVSFRNLIHYIYTGQVNAEALKSTGLYILAHECGLLRLKSRCSDCLISTLSFSSVLGIITLAKMYHDNALKIAAMAFATKDLSQVLETEDWRLFCIENEYEAKCLLKMI